MNIRIVRMKDRDEVRTAVRFVQTLAVVATAEQHHVRSRRFADERDLCGAGGQYEV